MRSYFVCIVIFLTISKMKDCFLWRSKYLEVVILDRAFPVFLQRHTSGKKDWMKREFNKVNPILETGEFHTLGEIQVYEHHCQCTSLPLWLNTCCVCFWDWDTAAQFFSNKKRLDLVNVQIIKPQQKETYLNVHCSFTSHTSWIIYLHCRFL